MLKGEGETNMPVSGDTVLEKTRRVEGRIGHVRSASGCVQLCLIHVQGRYH